MFIDWYCNIKCYVSTNRLNTKISAIVIYQVCMKTNPLYHPGAIAFNLTGSVPKVGQLMASAWSWSDVCRFQLKKKQTWWVLLHLPIVMVRLQWLKANQNFIMCNAIVQCWKCCSDLKDGKLGRGADINIDMPPPPSPASSTCSEQSGPILVSPGSATASKLLCCWCTCLFT